jgi:serine protease
VLSLVAAVSTVALLLPIGATAASPDDLAALEPVVVRFEDTVPEADQARVLAAEGLVLVDRLPGSDYALALADPGATAPDGSGIEDVDPVVTYRAFGIPDDPYYRFQWHLPAIDAPTAWDLADGTGSVVAVIDSGVAYETTGPYVKGPDFEGTSFTPGWDFVGDDPNPNDDNGHGTHVTSTIAETTGNALGGAGVAPGATIMPLRVLDATGSGTDFDVARALRFAADHGATVANLSLGGPSSSDVLRDALAYARDQGVLVVAASGNDGESTVSYPAREDGVVAVGSVRFDLTRPAYSSFGAELDLVAPGGDVTVDQNGDRYGDGILQQGLQWGSTTAFCMCLLQGTSMAAPQVSAVAALVAASGVTDPAAIEQVMEATAVDLGAAGWDAQHGAGLVQAGAAVRATLGEAPLPIPTVPIPTPDPSGTPITVPTVPGTPVIVPVLPDAPALAVRGIELACPVGTTPAPAFGDLAETVHRPGIACATWWGVASGRTPDRYEPSGSVTRGQLASFIARTLSATGLDLPVDPPDAFPDDAGSVHERSIDQLAALRVVQGRGDGTFAPDAVVTRAEMATFLVRAHDVVAATPLGDAPDRFADDDASVHAPNIDKIAGAGLAGGVAPGAYSPTTPVQRGQMATFLARTIDLLVADGDTPPR